MAPLPVAIGQMRYILSVISALAFLHVARTASFGAPVPMTASNCPALFALEPSHADRYVVVLGARTATTAGVTMTLYTKAGSVILMRDAVAIDKALPQPPIPFRSTALAIAKSSDGPYLAATLHVTAATPTRACPPIDRIIHPQTSVSGPTAAQVLSFQKTIADEAQTQPLITPRTAPDSKAPTCSEPFVDAAIIGRAAIPVYPAAARAARATGLAMIKVLLDATGNVTDATVYKSSGNGDLDDAARTAARDSTYRASTLLVPPARRRLHLRGGLYRVTFFVIAPSIASRPQRVQRDASRPMIVVHTNRAAGHRSTSHQFAISPPPLLPCATP